MRTTTLILPIAIALALGGCARMKGEHGLVYGASGAYKPESTRVAARSETARSAVARPGPSKEEPKPVRTAAASTKEKPVRTSRLRKPPAPASEGRQVASLERRSVPAPKARPKPDEIGPALPSSVPDPSRVATGDEILASLLRTWNKMVDSNTSSKVLFDVWPEQIDGKAPTRADVDKRRERTRFEKDDLVAVR